MYTYSQDESWKGLKWYFNFPIVSDTMPKVPDTLAIMHGLLGVVKSEYESAGHLSSELLRSLHMLHGQTLVSALDLIDCKKVNYIDVFPNS